MLPDQLPTILKRPLAKLLMGLSSLLLAACGGIPEGAEPVRGFDLERYLGTWYEIARLDHRFERGLSEVTAQYSLDEDGKVSVLNRGFNTQAGEWETAEGRARFVGARDVGQLEVSFFGPFYGAYNIIALDQENYAWALVVGPNLDYLWILSRTPLLAPAIRQRLIEQARGLGFDTDQLILVDQSRNRNS